MKPQKNSGFSRNILPFLGAVMVVRLLFALIILSRQGPPGFSSSDADGYMTLAQSLLHGSFWRDGYLDIYRTPGYPLFLLPAAALHHALFLGILENFALAAFSAWLIWRIVIELGFDTNAAGCGVILYCFEPLGLFFVNQLISDMLFCTLVLLLIWNLLRYFTNSSLLSLLWTALALGAATYVRPVGIYLAPWLAPVLLLVPRASSRRRFATATLFLFTFAATLAPWMLRNRIVADYSGFSSSGDANLYFFSAAATEARVEHKSFVEAQAERGYSPAYFQVHPEQRTWSSGHIARFWHAEAWKVISSHWTVYAAIHLRGCLVVLLDGGGNSLAGTFGLYPRAGGLQDRIQDRGILRSMLWLFRQYPWVGFIVAALEIALAGYYFLALIGLRMMTPSARFLLVWVSVYFVLVSGYPGAVGRYRMPIMPLICIAGGIGISVLKNRELRKHQSQGLADSRQAVPGSKAAPVS